VLNLLKRLRWVHHFLASKEVAAVLFATLCVVLIPLTIREEHSPYLGVLIDVILGLIGLNLLMCTVQRLKTLSKPTLIIHLGVIVTLIGSVISSFGLLATVNIYEGSSVDKVYRWDTKEDVPLGVEVGVKKINMEYYPIPVKIGVLHGDEKVGLFELKTGESFTFDDYMIRADAFEFPSEILKLRVFNREGEIGYADTSGVKNLPANFPYDFVLVAFKNPSLKRMWVDLLLSKGTLLSTEGISEVNSPFSWEGINFYHTSVDRDKYGIPYAGIQITRDPGRPYVYAGFIITGLGSLLYLVMLLRRLDGHGRSIKAGKQC
jgi:hypothetical protein